MTSFWIYHKIHILFGKNQDAFMNNMEVFFVYCTYFRFFCSVCGKCTFLNGKYKDNTYKNIKIELHCPQESYLKSFWDSWMSLICNCNSQMMKIRKWLSTRITFKISLIFINGFHLIDSLSYKWNLSDFCEWILLAC